MRPLKDRPTQYASGYSLDLYCDRVHDRGYSAATFVGQTFADCAKQARFRGWKIHTATRTATCPSCVRGERK
jgi:hypothetical protein